MSGSRIPCATVFTIGGLLLALCCGQASGASLPLLEGSVGYAGELNADKETYHVRLYLGRAGDFVLHEELSLSGGKVSGWENTGRWHQIRNRAFVQLSDASGLCRLLTVGGSGNLYLGMQFSNGEQRTAVLRPQTAAPDGHTIVPIRGAATEISGPGRLPALRLRGIRSTPLEKKRLADNLAGDFLERVSGGTWQVTRLGSDMPAVVLRLRFIPDRGRHEGRLECFDGVRLLAGNYSLRDAELALSVDGSGTLLAALLQRTRFWVLTGEVLELLDKEWEPLALLEQVR